MGQVMIEPRLTELNQNEILLYLGYRGQEITPEVEKQISECTRQVLAYVQPRLVYRRLPVMEGKIAGMRLEGKDISQLLRSCQEAVLLAVTLGPRIEQLLMRSEVMNMSDAVVMDACASVAVENVCDCFEADLREMLEQEGLFLTSRFSPGYGDLPIDTQGRLCEALDTVRRIGLTVTENHIMVPRKSVTAVMGIATTPRKLRARGCEACNMLRNCPYRKSGTSCKK